MAVIQISKIQVRRGLQENLPALDTGEFGWSIDERRLWIGNGTTAEGAPTPGQTEILTVYSPIGAALSNIAIIEDEISALEANVAALQANSTSTVNTITLADNTAVATVANLTLNQSTTNIVQYNITRGLAARTGVVKISTINGTVVYDDEYDEVGVTGVVLTWQASGNVANLYYTTTSTGISANLNYYNPVIF